MPKIPPAKEQWYVVHVLSGQENSVAKRIRREVEREELGDYIYEVLVPTEMVEENRKGKKVEMKKKFFPGYIIVNMNLFTEMEELVDQSWYFIREMDGVIGFAGTKDKPIPMRPREVDSMLAQIKEREESVRPSIAFEVGDTVLVADGPFESQNGVVEEIDHELSLIHI